MNNLSQIIYIHFLQLKRVRKSEGRQAHTQEKKRGILKKKFIHIQKEEGVRGRGKKGKLIIYGKNKAKCGWIYLGA